MKNRRPIPKVLYSVYNILINTIDGRSYYLTLDAMPNEPFNTDSLAEARREAKKVSLNSTIKNVQIIKTTTSETILNTYIPTNTKTLTVDSFFSDDV